MTCHPPLSIVLDNTALEKLVCPRMFEQYVFEKKEPSGDQAALLAGGSIHQALAVLYRNFGQPPKAVLPVALQTLRESWTVPPDDWRTLPLAEGLLNAYVEHYPAEDFEPFLTGIEKSFLLRLGVIRGVQIWWTGIIDLPVRRKGNCTGLWIIDHKTASVFGGNYFDQFALSAAQTGYCWAWRELFQERPAGFEINTLVWRKPSKTGVPYEFGRQKFFLEEWHFDEWKKDVLCKVETILRYREHNYFPRETSQCVNKYHSKCGYLDVCSLRPEQRQGVLDSSIFKPVTWNPSEQNERIK